jgi:CPA1 family monovalent cation:H+ antiporter
MPAQAFLVGLTIAVAVLVGRVLSRRLRVPEAAAYVLVGVAAGLTPGLPGVQLSPEVVLVAFLPPLIYYAAFFSDPRQTVQHIVPVVNQSVGLVLITAGAAAALLVGAVPDIAWGAALAFGAAIAPPDPVAATSVLHRLGVPGRLVTVLEAEGLVNDAVALTLFSIALDTVGTPPTPGSVLLGVAIEVAGGIAIGVLVGFVVVVARKYIHDGHSQVVLSLATPYLAFVPADLVHASGVLATVTAAVWLSVRGRGLVEPTARMQAETFWETLNTLLVAVLFVLLGLQVPTIVAAVQVNSAGTLALLSGGLVLVVVVVRLAWALFVPPVLAWLPVRERAAVLMTRAERGVLGWCGPRGAVSLAVAMALPMTTANGQAFPHRNLLLFLAMAVVLATVVGQVLSLPVLVRWLRLSPDERERTEGLRARRRLVDAALRELDGIAENREVDPPAAEAYRQVLELRRERLLRDLDGAADPANHAENGSPPEDHRLQLRLVRAERRALRELYDSGEITGRTLRSVSQELDLDETRLRESG